MKLERLAVMTGVMRSGMTLRDFFREAARTNVPGLPYADADDRIVGRISVRHVFKHIAVPDNLVRLADAVGDRTDKLDLSDMRIVQSLALPVETHLLENITSVSPNSSIVKALVIMEAHNTNYIFLIENGEYRGVVTRMVIARRMLECIEAMESEGRDAPGADATS